MTSALICRDERARTLHRPRRQVGFKPGSSCVAATTADPGAVLQILISPLIWLFAKAACETNTTTASTVARFRGGIPPSTHTCRRPREPCNRAPSGLQGPRNASGVRRPAAARLDTPEPSAAVQPD
jgi:hypothetical protein